MSLLNEYMRTIGHDIDLWIPLGPPPDPCLIPDPPQQLFRISICTYPHCNDQTVFVGPDPDAVTRQAHAAGWRNGKCPAHAHHGRRRLFDAQQHRKTYCRMRGPHLRYAYQARAFINGSDTGLPVRFYL